MSRVYWENRYKHGQGSGLGSRGEKGQKRLALLNMLFDPKEDTIVDYGCGDLTLWGGGIGQARNAKLPTYYVGVNYARNILLQNETAFPLHTWLTPEEYKQYFKTVEKAKLVISFDTLFHQPTYNDCIELIHALSLGSKDTIVVNNWVKSPFGKDTSDGTYQYFRPMSELKPLFNKAGFYLDDTIYEDSINAIYVYTRHDTGVSG